MESFFSFFTTKKFPSRTTIATLLRGPLTTLSALVYGLFFAVCITIFILLITINKHFLVTVPARGGTLTEGVIGSAHFINPLLATTPTDQRLVALIYGSLMKEQPDGSIVASLAQNYTVSPDGMTYTIDLLPNLHFDDGKPLTSNDVVFTVQKLQDDNISSDSQYWQNITVENPDANTVVFSLPAADTSFLSHLTFGILPEHVWQTISDQSFTTAPQNLAPVGAGPFKMASIAYADGIPTTVVLKRNTRAAGTPTLLSSLVIQSYANQTLLINALNDHDINFSYSVTPEGLAEVPLDARLHAVAVPTTQTVSLYHSGSDTALAKASVVAALNQMIDKNAIIATVQHGYGTSVGSVPRATAKSSSQNSIPGFSIAVENDPQLLLAAQTVAEQLEQYGVTVAVKAFDPGVFQQSISAGTFSLFLARSNDYVIPDQYSVALPLYTESLPYVSDTETHTIIPDTMDYPATEYADVSDWYTHTDKLWKWFVRKE